MGGRHGWLGVCREWQRKMKGKNQISLETHIKFSRIKTNILKTRKNQTQDNSGGTRGNVQQLRPLTVPPEILSLIPSNYMVLTTLYIWDLMTSSGIQAYMQTEFSYLRKTT